MGDDFHALAAAVVLSSSSDEEDEIDFLVQHWKRDIPRIKNYSEYVVDNLEDDLFQKHFRITRSTCDKLTILFEASNIYPVSDLGGKPLESPKIHILAFLWKQYCAKKRFDISISCLHAMNDRVMNFLLHIAPCIISFPQTELEKQLKADEFQQISDLPGVVGCIDGTYINIRTPAHKINSTYINRHDQISLTLQGICDAKNRFIDCFTGTSSKIHDSSIFRMSFIYPVVNELCPKFYILSDAAYGLSTNVLTPYRDYRALTEVQRSYNFKHAATRVKIENSFATLKARLRQLIRPDSMTVTKMSKFIMSCCVIRNLCIENDDFLDELPEYLGEIRNHRADVDDNVNFAEAVRQEGERKREMIPQML